MVNYEHNTYRVTWSDEDREFVGLSSSSFFALKIINKNQTEYRSLL
ncbi:MAG: hypothetical protein AB4368_22025 [Xenococcaceae cyanobacterium]